MDKQMLEQIAMELQWCGKTLMTLSERLTQPYKASEATATKQPQEEAAPTLEDVRTALAEKSRMGFTAEVRGILTAHGANRLSEVDPSEYAVILKEAESLGK